jgi:gas vesicle protein
MLADQPVNKESCEEALMQKCVRTFALTLTMLAALAPELRAQEPMSSDDREVMSYKLTMPAVKKWEAAMRSMVDMAKKDPDVQKYTRMQSQIEALQKKDELTETEQEQLEKLREQVAAMEEDSEEDDLDDDATLTELAAKIAKVKPAADALRQAGITPREYLVFSLALMHASLYVGMKQSGMATERPEDVSPANIKFVEDNWAQLKAIQDEYQKANKQIDIMVKKRS